MPRSSIVHGKCMLTLYKKLPNYFSEQLYHFTFPPAMYEWFVFSLILANILCYYYFLFLIFWWVCSEWCHVVLICIFLMANDGDRLFMCSSAFACPLWWNVCLCLLPAFWLECLVFYCWVLRVFHAFEIQVLCQTCLVSFRHNLCSLQ